MLISISGSNGPDLDSHGGTSGNLLLPVPELTLACGKTKLAWPAPFPHHLLSSSIPSLLSEHLGSVELRQRD